MKCDLFQEELRCLFYRCYRSVDGQSAILYFNESREKPCSEWKASSSNHIGGAGAPCFLISPGASRLSDEPEEQIYPRGIGFCIDSPTALLRVVELWLFPQIRAVRVCLCLCHVPQCMCVWAALVDGHRDAICMIQQEAVITSSPCRILQTSAGVGSKKKPLIVLIRA